ncbi:MAG: hypothetical protein IPK94_07595 [Saprospiraceae bacterium]|nr:hypothetical protein [Saprospiraceae bacterium]
MFFKIVKDMAHNGGGYQKSLSGTSRFWIRWVILNLLPTHNGVSVDSMISPTWSDGSSQLSFDQKV